MGGSQIDEIGEERKTAFRNEHFGLGLVLCMMKASPNKIIIVFIIYKLI